MKPASWLLALAALGMASAGWAQPARRAERRLAGVAEALPSTEPQRVVVSEGDGKTARFVNELEQELKASSYVVVRVAKIALEPEAMLQALREAHASRGILLSEDGKSVLVLAASAKGSRLRVYGEYSVDRENRLARRRQWISLVERLRVPTEDEDDAVAGDPLVQPATSPTPASAAVAGDASQRADDSDVLDRRASRLGVAVSLGYVTGRTGLTSHLLLVGHRRLGSWMNLIAHGLWPMVPGERVTADGVRSRVWTFSGAVGLAVDPGRPSWWVSPYFGMTLGLQFLLGYVEWPGYPITDVYRVASLSLDIHAGVRVSLGRGTWLLVQVAGGRLSSLATRRSQMTDSLAQAWVVRSAVGLLMAL
jgi:hypothetical protein